jgi:hypothetical protein
MPALDTVGKIIGYARVLLQDTLVPYRYPDADLINALNAGLLDARRLRPDLFLYTPNDVPFYTADNDMLGIPENPPLPTVLDEVVTIDQQYRMALVYFVAGQAQLRDEEEVTDARAAAFTTKFMSMLIEPMMPQGISR